MTRTFLTTFSLLALLSTGALAQTTGATGTSGNTATPERPARPVKPADVPADYRLTMGDKLRVEVYRDEQLSQTLQIRPDGRITLPLVGDVMAAGKTSVELRDTLAGALGEFVRNPEVTVIVVETVPMNVYVMGEVNSPGAKPVHGETPILQVLAMAGGFTEWAKRKDVRVLRPGPTGAATLTFNYNDAVNGRARMLTVRPGDTIIVP
jgi:polysaccharide biosynthesis/export protein